MSSLKATKNVAQTTPQTTDAGGGGSRLRTFTDSIVVFKARRIHDKTWKGEARAIVNPTSFTETVEPQYSLRPVLGLSHEIVQYIRTAARTISMDLFVSYQILQLQNQGGSMNDPVSIVLKWRNFFQSLVVPSRAGLAPPLVSFDWPGADLHFKGVVTSLTIEYQRFALNGSPMEFNMSLAFVEVADRLMTSDKVWKHGIGMKAYGGQSPFDK